VTTQRQRRQKLPPDKLSRLEALGFEWDPHQTFWEEGYRHLAEYVKSHGHCRVPSSHVDEDGFRLGQWTVVQRTKNHSLPADRRSRLSALGFEWDQKAAKWNDALEQLSSFVDECGHAQVPAAYVTTSGFRLGTWVSKQREKVNRLSLEQRERLNSLGFVWRIR